MALNDASPPAYEMEDVKEFFTIWEEPFVLSKMTDYISLKN